MSGFNIFIYPNVYHFDKELYIIASSYIGVFEYLIYPVIGFVGALLALEVGWHFTACTIRDETMKPCLFKQVKLAFVRA